MNVKFRNKNTRKDTKSNLDLVLNQIEYFGVKSTENYKNACEAFDHLKIIKIKNGKEITGISNYLIPNKDQVQDRNYKTVEIIGEKQGKQIEMSFIYAGAKDQSYLNNIAIFASFLQEENNSIICKKNGIQKLHDIVQQFVPKPYHV